jgi:hypothetical protein
MQAVVDAWVRTANGSVNLAMASMAERAGEQYVYAMSKASLAVTTGTFTFDEAIKRSIIETGQKGLPIFIDRANREWSPEGYTSTVIRTNQRRVSEAVMFQTGDELGTDLVEISSHVGSRPLCAPYQGKIYSRSGKSEKYDALDSTSYGEPAGLGGINCGHIFYPYIEGVSIQRNTPYPERENEKVYKESQVQRSLERNVRYYERQYQFALTGNTGQAEAYKQKLEESRKNVKDFTKETGRTRRPDREAIYSS